MRLLHGVSRLHTETEVAVEKLGANEAEAAGSVLLRQPL
jgi:hypothetical protein